MLIIGSAASTCACFFFFSSRRRHTRSLCDWSSDVCSSDLSASSALPANVSNDDRSKLQTLERDLKSVVFGQDKALEALASSVKMARSGLEIGRASCRERV